MFQSKKEIIKELDPTKLNTIPGPPRLTLPYKRFLPNAQAPLRAIDGAAGYDLFAATEEIKIDLTGPTVTYDTGIGVNIPPGFVGIVVPRSSISKNTTLMLANSCGIIDSGYSGSIKFIFRQVNPGYAKKYNVGDRVGQLLIMPVCELELEEINELPESDRGNGGFGSTGL